MNYKQVKFEHLLASVDKPARYIAQEINSVGKTITSNTINFCLAFPDVYEVGFSHLGLKILYSILNSEDDAVADRVYLPWPDFGEKLKNNNIALFGLESRIALKEFDIIGITLQSELTFSNVLYLLDLAEIPLFSKDRNDLDPIVIAGGPCVSNPETMADFFDAVLIGDGEEAIIEIKNSIKETKNSSRNKKLIELSQIKGVYVPSLYKFENNKYIPKYEYVPAKIKIRKFMDFDNEDKLHKNQLVPWLLPTHGRYVSEIMRGCSRGCRFCHAGMFYRPVRERDPQKILAQIENAIEKSGWDEVALTSLSSSDYNSIKYVLYELYQNSVKTRTSISLPSLRIDSLDNDIIKLLKAMKQKGLTLAPEAGSQKLRNIINKNISEEDILKGVQIALENGWQLIKLYFMIGLPFEEKSDIKAIIELIEKIVEISNKKLRINITISPFVPKSFTPFQWTEMSNKDSLLEKAYLIKNSLKKYKFIKIKYHTIEKLILECVLGRGDRKISKWIYAAYQEGAMFDGWEEFFNFHKWETAAQKIGFDYQKYLNSIDFEEILPWEHIDLGITKDFLLDEWQKAEKQQTTADCRTDECTNCGICDEKIRPVYASEPDFKIGEITKPKINNQLTNYYYRIFFSKTGLMRFVAHLDLLRMFQRVLRTSQLPVSYSQGFSPRPFLSLSPPLSSGIEGENEYFDISLREYIEPKKVLFKFSRVFPDALTLKNVIPLLKKEMRSMEYYPFEEIVVYPLLEFYEHFAEATEKYITEKNWEIVRIRKKKLKKSDLKDIIKEIKWEKKYLFIIKKHINANIFDILDSVYNIKRDNTDNFRIIRKRFLR